jgi:predicted DNA-binding transcriptional regulator AlpA
MIDEKQDREPGDFQPRSQDGVPAIEGPRLLTVDELAGWLRISTRTVWRMESSGKLPSCLRFGRAKRWTDVAIRDWIAAGCPSRSDLAARRAFEAAGPGLGRNHGKRRSPLR